MLRIDQKKKKKSPFPPANIVEIDQSSSLNIFIFFIKLATLIIVHLTQIV